MAIGITNVQTSSGSGTAISVTKPTGMSNGDLLVVVINHNGPDKTTADNNGATPTTKQIEVQGSVPDNTGAIPIFYRYVGYAEPATYAFTLSGSDRWTIVAFGLSGADRTFPFNVLPADGNDETSAAPTCPGATVIANSMALAVAGTDGTGAGTFSGGPSTWTEVGTVNLQQPLSVFYKMMPSAGATSDQDFATSTSGFNYTVSIFSIAQYKGYKKTPNIRPRPFAPGRAR